MMLSMSDTSKPSPYDAPELYDLLFDSLDFDVPYWVEVGRGAGGPVLELACGSGRLLLPIRRAGVDIDGLDASPAMIARLKERARAEGLEVRAEVADMRDFAMGRRYARIFCGFNGFAHCETIEDQLAVLRSARRHLAPGGALVIHMSYPGPALLVRSRTGSPSWSTRRRGPAAASSSSGTTGRRTSSASARIPRSRSGSSTPRNAPSPPTSSRPISAGSTGSSSSSCSGRPASPALEFLGGFDGRPLRAPDDQMIAWGTK